MRMQATLCVEKHVQNHDDQLSKITGNEAPKAVQVQ